MFGKILDHYGSEINIRPLSLSYRSSPPIIETVNRIFGDLSGSGLSDNVITQWGHSWQTHSSATSWTEDEGYSAIVEPCVSDGMSKPDAEDRYAITAGILKEVNPVSRRLSTAVLVRSNQSGKALVEYLRTMAPDIPVVHEGRSGIVDNPVVTAILSLLTLAAHPGNTYAWQHVLMSPFAEWGETV